MTHREILSEKFFGELYADISSDCPSHIYVSVSEDDSSSEYNSDSDDVNIRPKKRQKSLVIDSDAESENETHGAGENFTGVTIEYDNLQSVTEITELTFWPAKIKIITNHRCLFLQKSPSW